jgi:hypothetical protein
MDVSLVLRVPEQRFRDAARRHLHARPALSDARVKGEIEPKRFHVKNQIGLTSETELCTTRARGCEPVQ